jgi:hypothetical protein
LGEDFVSTFVSLSGEDEAGIRKIKNKNKKKLRLLGTFQPTEHGQSPLPALFDSLF